MNKLVQTTLLHNSVLTCAVLLECLALSGSLGARGFPLVRHCTAAGAPRSLNCGTPTSCVYQPAPSAYQPPSNHHLCKETWKVKENMETIWYRSNKIEYKIKRCYGPLCKTGMVQPPKYSTWEAGLHKPHPSRKQPIILLLLQRRVKHGVGCITY